MQPLISGSPNGISCRKASRKGGERGEVKHLSTRRNKKQIVIS